MNSIAIERVLGRLDSVRRTSSGYVATCPAHDDHHPSLVITEGDDGRALLHCFAGCSTASILTATALTFTDLFADSHAKGAVRR